MTKKERQVFTNSGVLPIALGILTSSSDRVMSFTNFHFTTKTQSKLHVMTQHFSHQHQKFHLCHFALKTVFVE